jgi:hypothetical protein
MMNGNLYPLSGNIVPMDNPDDYMMQADTDDHEHFADDVDQLNSSNQNS